MKRGSYGPPYRPPADGWFVPPRAYLGGLYQHARPALNNLPRYQNNTQVTLQPGQIGSPQTRGAITAPNNCEEQLNNGLPNIPYIGTANAQAPANAWQNTYALNGTNSFGQTTRQRGFKNVQAVRQWHGTPPWTSHDPLGGANCNNTACVHGNPGDSDYAVTWYESYQPTPAQTKYTTLNVSADLDVLYQLPGDGGVTGTYEILCHARGAISVNPASGKITNTLTTTETDTETPTGASAYTRYQSTNGTGAYYDNTGAVTQAIRAGATTKIDGVCGADVHCAAITCPHTDLGWYGDGGSLLDLIGAWNQNWPNGGGSPPYGFTAATPLPQPTDINNYAATASLTYGDGTIEAITLSWTRTDTIYSWNVQYTRHDWSGTLIGSYTFTGSLTLANANTAAALQADAINLLNYWPLNNDALYPFRTDGLWPIAPLVSRDETELNRTPLTGFLPATLDDLRTPITDQDGNAPWTTPVTPPPLGWTYAPNNNDNQGRPSTDPGYSGAAAWIPTYNQMAWYDDAAYGFTFPTGRDASNSPANGFVQYALTGLICGMPLPQAITDPNSIWYHPAAPIPSNAACENFFDFRAKLYKSCCYTDPETGQQTADWYLYGYGEWLYDAITRTGAQLPHNATQWTNNLCALRLPPYAWAIQGDKQTYDSAAHGCSTTNQYADRQDALWMQKCCEIDELWPSQDFFRPAGPDRFAPDETAVYCIANWTGNTAYFPTDPANIAAGDYVGVNNNGNSGVYSVASVDHAGQSVTLGTFHYPLPTGFALPSGDQDTALWRIRWPNAWPIQGRDPITTLADAGSGNTTLTLATADVNLMTGDPVDIYTADMALVAFDLSVTRVDDMHFTVHAALASLAGAAYLTSHGAPAYYWDDNGRKGDFVTHQWVADYRTNGEATRLAGATDCGGHTPPTGTPATNYGFASYNATAQTIPFKPCCYSVIAITPNNETWPNGVIIPFPANLTFDERYGSRWQAEIEQVMTDLYWQAPHQPCTLGPNDTWNQDDGTCRCPGGCPNAASGTDYYYAYPPLVEARITLPVGAPALPAGITLGYASPLTSSSGLQPPAPDGYDATSGNPLAVWTIWGYRLAIESHACAGSCQFDYVNMENLACVQTAYTPPSTNIAQDANTAAGMTGQGIT